MNTLEVLVKARELISVPERWTKHVLAKNGDGDNVDPYDPSAVCWCGMGAIVSVTPPEQRTIGPMLDHWLSLPAMLRLKKITNGKIFPDFNDYHTHAEVLAAFDAAIEAERASL